MNGHLANSFKKNFYLLFIFTLPVILSAQVKTVKIPTKDKIQVTADIYNSTGTSRAIILLFHQTGNSRGEYVEIAPKLTAMGFTCIAVDLRSGGEVNGIENKTFRFADSLRMETRFTDAYTDIMAAVWYAKKTYPGSKLILFGSSYSASLAIKYAGEYPDGINGVVAFSPGEYFSKFGWKRDIIELSAAKVKCSVFITSAPNEVESWQAIYNAIPGNNKVSFVPAKGEGKHGAKTLWPVFPENTVYWAALKDFLKRY